MVFQGLEGFLSPSDACILIQSAERRRQARILAQSLQDIRQNVANEREGPEISPDRAILALQRVTVLTRVQPHGLYRVSQGRFPTFDRTQHASTWTDFPKILHKQTISSSLETFRISDISIKVENIFIHQSVTSLVLVSFPRLIVCRTCLHEPISLKLCTNRPWMLA